MFWEDEDDKTLPFKAPENIVDVLFAMRCKSLPIDHAWALSQQIQKHLPWLSDYRGAGIHHIQVAESNNGWVRPTAENALLFPSRRTKLVLRVPAEKLTDLDRLVGEQLSIEDHTITLGSYKKKPLGNSGVIFARHMVMAEEQSENELMEAVAAEVRSLTGSPIKKMLCGKTHSIKTPQEHIKTIHLMIADLDDDTSIKIQQDGLGSGRELGCGLFLPHKSIKTLKPTE